MKKQRTPYKICERCGAHLDTGEICDCRITPASERATAETARRTPPERAYYGARYTRDASGNIRLASVSLVGRSAPQ